MMLTIATISKTFTSPSPLKSAASNAQSSRTPEPNTWLTTETISKTLTTPSLVTSPLILSHPSPVWFKSDKNLGRILNSLKLYATIPVIDPYVSPTNIWGHSPSKI